MGDAVIDIRKLKELVKLMVENDLSELDLRDEGETVVVKRGVSGGGVSFVPQAPAGSAGQVPAVSTGGVGEAASTEDEDAGLHAIVSPMVGTFYSSPDPESPVYVKAGDEVDAETVVCIVEAMKVFSEIKAECTGTVEKVLVKNGEAVEYGQTLFLVRPR